MVKKIGLLILFPWFLISSTIVPVMVSSDQLGFNKNQDLVLESTSANEKSSSQNEEAFSDNTSSNLSNSIQFNSMEFYYTYLSDLDGTNYYGELHLQPLNKYEESVDYLKVNSNSSSDEIIVTMDELSLNNYTIYLDPFQDLNKEQELTLTIQYNDLTTESQTFEYYYVTPKPIIYDVSIEQSDNSSINVSFNVYNNDSYINSLEAKLQSNSKNIDLVPGEKDHRYFVTFDNLEANKDYFLKIDVSWDDPYVDKIGQEYNSQIEYSEEFSITNNSKRTVAIIMLSIIGFLVLIFLIGLALFFLKGGKKPKEN